MNAMAEIALKPHAGRRQALRHVTAWDRLKVNRNWLGFWFMLPAAAILVLFLAYPLSLGVWLSFTDARIGRGGAFVGVGELSVAVGGHHLLAVGVQHAALHDASPRSSSSQSASTWRCCSTSTCRSRP